MQYLKDWFRGIVSTDVSTDSTTKYFHIDILSFDDYFKRSSIAIDVVYRSCQWIPLCFNCTVFI